MRHICQLGLSAVIINLAMVLPGYAESPFYHWVPCPTQKEMTINEGSAVGEVTAKVGNEDVPTMFISTDKAIHPDSTFSIEGNEFAQNPVTNMPMLLCHYHTQTGDKVDFRMSSNLKTISHQKTEREGDTFVFIYEGQPFSK